MPAPPAVQAQPQAAVPGSTLSARPQLTQSPQVKTGKVIEGAPVLRNLKSDVTRFVPTNLRVKRDDGAKGGAAGVQKPKKPAAPQYSSGLAPQQARTQPSGGQMRAPPKEKKTKDDAYADFMKEMQDLL